MEGVKYAIFSFRHVQSDSYPGGQVARNVPAEHSGVFLMTLRCDVLLDRSEEAL